MVQLTMLVMAATMASVAGATDLGVNLLVNPDAETGDMSGWTPQDQVQVVDAEAATDMGLPPGVSIGDWCFTGGLGEPIESCVQTIDVADLAGVIDAGGLPCTVRGLLQNRESGGVLDSVTLVVNLLDANGGLLAAYSFNDPSLATLWDEVEEVFETPIGTRSIGLEIVMMRSGGASTDAFADNIELILGECAADCDGNGSLNILDFVCFQGEFQGQTDAGDCDGNGVHNILDFVCFQGLFVAGCP